MIQEVQKKTVAFEADPTTELDRNRLGHLKLSLEEKFAALKQLTEEILDLVKDGEVNGEIEEALSKRCIQRRSVLMNTILVEARFPQAEQALPT